jgi:MFS family permease
MISLSGLQVVLFQFWISRHIRRYPPFLIMAIGALFLSVGFGMIGFVSGTALFMLAIIIITFGEMIFYPTGQVLAVSFAPAHMRGRYMALYGLAWAIPATIGPAAAGLILDNFDPNLLWFLGGVLCVIAAIGFDVLHLWLGRQKRFAPPPATTETSPSGELETP